MNNATTKKYHQKELAVLSAVMASFTASQTVKGKGVLAAVVAYYRLNDPSPPSSRNEIKEKAVAFANVIGYHGDIERIVTLVIADVGIA